VNFRHQRAVFPLALTILLGVSAPAQTEFRQLERGVIEARIKDVVDANDAREAEIKELFEESGCTGDKLSEQTVKGKLPPNVICTLPGKTDQIIVVGAHTDKVSEGHGVVDNWSGACLLPSLYYSLDAQPRHSTYLFIGFTGEEKGMVGSDFYVHHLTPEQRSKIVAVVNMDTLALGPTKVWASHADKALLKALASVAASLKLPLAVMNVDAVGSTDSESFAEVHIPRITIHSVTQETWAVLHSDKDKMSAVKMDDYYESYRLIAAYLAYLDTSLGEPATPTDKRRQ
jgi:putative aminopeptidase FrvX